MDETEEQQAERWARKVDIWHDDRRKDNQQTNIQTVLPLVREARAATAQLEARIEQVEALMVLYRNEGRTKDAEIVQKVLGILRGAKS